MTADQLARVQAMTTESLKWDLSPNDRDALRAVLARLALAERVAEAAAKARPIELDYSQEWFIEVFDALDAWEKARDAK
jgi:hypothetical protein